MLKAVPDEMVTTFAIVGTPDEVRERVSKLWPYADSMTLSPPSNFISPARLNEYRAALVEALYKVA